MPKKQSNQLLYDAIKERGRLFMVTFRELSERYGETEAIEIMQRVSYEFGTAIGKSLACFAPRDFEGMAHAYAKAPDGGATYSPDIRQLDDTCLEVKMMRCPIKDSWVDAGCSDEEISILLHCAYPVDAATFETAGFDYRIEMWSPGKEGCCLTRITEKANS